MSGFFMQSNLGGQGNFEVVTPLAAGGFVRVERDNDTPGLPWRPFYFGAGPADAAALIQSSYDRFDGARPPYRNLQVVARFADRLVHYRVTPEPRWYNLGPITAGASGTPALVENRLGRNPTHAGNFELVCPIASGGLAHWWRDNSGANPGPWSGPTFFGSGSVRAAALFQSNYGTRGDLMVVALVGDQLMLYSRDDAYNWHGPTLITGGVSGDVAAIQSTFGMLGNFEVVAGLAAGGLGHWWRDNDAGETWNGPVMIASGAVEAVSLIQSNYTDSPSGLGHLEVVARSGNRLDSWSRQSIPPWRWSSTGQVFDEVPCVSGVTGQNRLPYESEIVGIHMALLATGRVLLFAFADQVTNDNDMKGISRVIEPDIGVVTRRDMTSNGFCAGHSHLADGRVLVAGGHWEDVAGYRTFDPVTETWTELQPPMPHGRWYPTCVTLSDGTVFVISGTVMHGPVTADVPLHGVNNTVQVFDPTTGMGAERGVPLPFSQQDSFEPVDLYPFCHLLPSGKVMVHSRRTTRFYDPATPGWEAAEVYANHPYSRSYPGGGTSVLLPLDPEESPPYRARVLIAGGAGADAVPGQDPSQRDCNTPATNSVELLDLSDSALSWRPLPPMSSARVMPDAVLLPDGTVLVAGGGASGWADRMPAPVYELEIYDPRRQAWTSMCPIHVPRLYHSTAILLPDARVMMAGRSGMYQLCPSAFDYAEHRIEIFSPPYLFQGPRPVIDGAPSVARYGDEIMIQTAQAGAIDAVALLRAGAVTHGLNMDQRYVALSITGRSPAAVTVRVPPDGNVAPPGDYLLFALIGGVPSVAPFIRLGPASGRQPAVRGQRRPVSARRVRRA